MHEPTYYREQADRARRLARQTVSDICAMLLEVAQDFDEVAEDLENGAVEIRHPERMPQQDQ